MMVTLTHLPKVSNFFFVSELEVNEQMDDIEQYLNFEVQDSTSLERRSPAPVNENIQLMSPISFSSRHHAESQNSNKGTSTMLAQQVILDEQMRATYGISLENCQRLTLRGTEENQRRELSNFILTTPGRLLRILPKLSILGNDVIDVGGVFRDSINRLFKSLYESDIFAESTSNMKSF
jgi:hypothetical protein